MLIDSHCHLDRVKTNDFPCINDCIAHTQKSGVSHILNVCIDFNNFNNVLDIAKENDNIYASIGIHPCATTNTKLKVEDLTSKTKHKKIIAIGETGLDYHYSKEALKSQHQYFRTHIQAANSTSLPLIIHTREAREDTIKIMREEKAQSGVMHCFTENWDMAKQALDLGFYISFSGIITFKNAVSLREVAYKTPLDRILIETDAPYLAPEPFRGKPNQPLYVKYVAEKMAEIKGVGLDEIAQQTSYNFARLFNIDL